jgi:hypothetical protein
MDYTRHWLPKNGDTGYLQICYPWKTVLKRHILIIMHTSPRGVYTGTTSFTSVVVVSIANNWLPVMRCATLICSSQLLLSLITWRRSCHHHSAGHHIAIYRLLFSPKWNCRNTPNVLTIENKVWLSSCGEVNCVDIFTINCRSMLNGRLQCGLIYFTVCCLKFFYPHTEIAKPFNANNLLDGKVKWFHSVI